MSEDTDTVELPPIKRPSRWIDVAIGVLVFAVIVFICLSSTCGQHHV
jgi:hypothetical protein